MSNSAIPQLNRELFDKADKVTPKFSVSAGLTEEVIRKIKQAKDTFSKIALTKELDELVTQYKNELITKFQREKK